MRNLSKMRSQNTEIDSLQKHFNHQNLPPLNPSKQALHIPQPHPALFIRGFPCPHADTSATTFDAFPPSHLRNSCVTLVLHSDLKQVQASQAKTPQRIPGLARDCDFASSTASLPKEAALVALAGRPVIGRVSP